MHDLRDDEKKAASKSSHFVLADTKHNDTILTDILEDLCFAVNDHSGSNLLGCSKLSIHNVTRHTGRGEGDRGEERSELKHTFRPYMHAYINTYMYKIVIVLLVMPTSLWLPEILQCQWPTVQQVHSLTGKGFTYISVIQSTTTAHGASFYRQGGQPGRQLFFH